MYGIIQKARYVVLNLATWNPRGKILQPACGLASVIQFYSKLVSIVSVNVHARPLHRQEEGTFNLQLRIL